MSRTLRLLLAALGLSLALSCSASAATLFVNTPGDLPDKKLEDGVCADANGGCSLRAALENAQVIAGGNTIYFSSNVTTIKPVTQLPEVPDLTVIDGRSLDGQPYVEIDGSDVPDPVGGGGGGGSDPGDGGPIGFTSVGPEPDRIDGNVGLFVTGNNVDIRGLVVNSFTGAQIAVVGATGVSVKTNGLGLSRDGTQDRGPRNPDPHRTVGVALFSATDARIGGSQPREGNIVSGLQFGVYVGGTSTGTNVEGNFLGVSGTADRFVIPNDLNAIFVTPTVGLGAPSDTTIRRNTIAGTSNGPGITVNETSETLISDNTIGFDPVERDGRDPLGRSYGVAREGILVHASEDTRVIGNRVSGSGRDGIFAYDTIDGIEIQGNVVGYDYAGLETRDANGKPTGNFRNGIHLEGLKAGTLEPGPVKDAVIGGTEPSQANFVAGNSQYGIHVTGAVPGAQVLGNYLGLRKTPEEDPQDAGGIGLGEFGDAKPVETRIEGNVIGNEPVAIGVYGGQDAAVVANSLGLGADGKGATPNDYGVDVEAPDTTVRGNYIGASAEFGVLLYGKDASGAVVEGNKLGLGVDGIVQAAQANRIGIGLGGDESHVRAPLDAIVGGSEPEDANVIAGGEIGINVAGDYFGKEPITTRIVGNALGVDEQGNHTAKTAQRIGIRLHDAGPVAVGTPGLGNEITGSTYAGVKVLSSDGATVQGNVIKDAVRGAQVISSRVSVGAATTWDEKLEPGPCTLVDGCNRFVDAKLVSVQVPGGDVIVRGNEYLGDAQTVDHGTDPDDQEDPQPVLDPLQPQNENGFYTYINAPTVVQRIPSDDLGTDYVTGAVEVDDPEHTIVDVYGEKPFADKDPLGEQADFLGTVTPDRHGQFKLAIDGFDDHTRFTAQLTQPFDPKDGSGLSTEYGTGCPRAEEPDADGDGICDAWETSGIDYDHDGKPDFDLAANGAKVGRRDVFVEADAMVPFQDSTLTDLDTFKPMVKAFADQGVGLHFVGGRRPEQVDPAIVIAAQERVRGEFNDLGDYRWGSDDDPCDGRFGTPAMRRAPNCLAKLGAEGVVTRYYLSARRLTDRQDGFSMATDSFGVRALADGIGHFSDSDIIASARGGKGCGNAGTCADVLRTRLVMRELGLTMGLDGEDEFPGRLSIMNPQYGLPRTGEPLDFSRGDGPAIDETNVDDQVGLPVPATARARGWRVIATTLQSQPGGFDCLWTRLPAAGPFDFDHSGELEPGGREFGLDDPHGDCAHSAGPSVTTGTVGSEWESLVVAMPIAEDYRGAGERHALRAARRLAGGGASDLDADGVLDEDDVCPLVADPGQADVDDDGFGEACGDEAEGADLSLSLDGEGRIDQGSTSTLTVAIANDWPRPAGAATVKLTPPSGTELVGTDGTWQVDGLPARGSRILEFGLTGRKQGPGVLRAEIVAAADPDNDSTPGAGDDDEDDVALFGVRVVGPDAVNHAPVCAPLASTGGVDQVQTLRVSCTDADGDALTVRTVRAPSSGTLSGWTGSRATWTPAPGFTGVVTAAVRASDGVLDSEPVELTLSVKPADGAAGGTGADGSDGAPGQDGAPGATGADGTMGPTGASGATGAPGATGVRGPDAVGGTAPATALAVTTDGLARGRRVAVTVTGPAAASGTLRILSRRGKAIRLGTAAFTVGPDGTVAVRVRLAKRLRRATPVRIVATTASGRAVTRVTLRR